MQQLSVMLQTNIQQKTSITSNQVNTSLNINWILDPGAINQMPDNKNLLINYKSYDGKQFIIVKNGEKMKTLRISSINLFFQKIISNVLHIRNCTSNLLFK
jgi:hypothetical protein